MQLHTIQSARQRVEAMTVSQKACYQFEFVRSFYIEPGESGEEQLPMASEGDFEQISYNIAHDAVVTDRPKVRFKAQASGESQSSDFLLLPLIATPGNVAAGGIRFGERPFWRFYPAKDALTIQWDGREVANRVRVDITFKGWMFPDYSKKGM